MRRRRFEGGTACNRATSLGGDDELSIRFGKDSCIGVTFKAIPVVLNDSHSSN